MVAGHVEQADALVVAERVGGDAGLLGRLGDGERLGPVGRQDGRRRSAEASGAPGLVSRCGFVDVEGRRELGDGHGLDGRASSAL
jgi:hypothetical protein